VAGSTYLYDPVKVPDDSTFEGEFNFGTAMFFQYSGDDFLLDLCISIGPELYEFEVYAGDPDAECSSWKFIYSEAFLSDNERRCEYFDLPVDKYDNFFLLWKNVNAGKIEITTYVGC
jgi:hypothetical protein